MLLPADADLFRVPLGTGASMHVARYGYGDDAIVLLHGFGTSSFLWRHVGPLLAVQGARAFALDLFGYGESDRPFDAEFGLDAQSGYLDAAMTALQLQRATVVGVDVGALVALRLAFDRPERIYRLVLVGPPPLEDLAGPEIRELQRDTARYALRLSRGLFGAESLLRPFLEGSVANPERMPWKLLGRYLAPYLGADGATHLLALAGALREEEFEDLDLRRLRQRTLVVRGTRDRWCSRTIAEQYAELIPRAIYQAVDEVGHLVPEEDAASLARLILAFVRTREDAQE
ncbi:MAG: alpha/beta hydrolase [Gemmatimonadaceae bacterium]|nr:alpha/beta hydrolase [Gemmatimonadaceae bacterium]